MLLPDYLKVVAFLNNPDTRSQALESLASEGPDRSSETLRALLPYLSLPTLLSLRSSHKSLGQVITETLYDLIDAQRDWVVSPECPAELRDAYLVHVFGKGWTDVKVNMDDVANSQAEVVLEGLVIDAEDAQEDEKAEDIDPCLSLDGFEQDLRTSSGGLLDEVDWSNVVLGGGSVLSILTGKSDDAAYATSDFDLFLYGLKADELVPKVASLIEQIRSALPDARKLTKSDTISRDVRFENIRTKRWTEENDVEWRNEHKGDLLIIKGFNAITLVPPRTVFPRKTIQIVLQTHPTVFDALAWFDLDACAVGYTGSAVVALPRAIRSLSLGDWTGGVNLLDPRLARKGDASGSMLATRTMKYLPRGFSLAVPAAALTAVESKLEYPFDRLIRKARRHAKRDFFAKDTHESLKVFPAAGLQGLLLREQRFLHHLAEKAKAAAAERGEDVSSADESVESGEWSQEYDYGHGWHWVKRVTDQDLQRRETTDVFQDFWKFNLKQLDPAISGLMWELNENKAMLDRSEAEYYERYSSYGGRSSKPVPPAAPAYADFSEFVVPYVTSFDASNAIGALESRVKPEPERQAAAPRRKMAVDTSSSEGENDLDEEEEDDCDEKKEESASGSEELVWPAEFSLRETALSFQILEALSLEVRRVQYVVKLPRSVLPIMDRAEEKMKALLARLSAPRSATADSSAPLHALRYSSPAFPPAIEQTLAKITMKTDTAVDCALPDLSEIHVPVTEPVRRYVPNSFPGPTRRGEKIHLGAFSGSTAASPEVAHFLSPLSPTDDAKSKAGGTEAADTKWVYRIATLAGLWQFKGLDPEIDQALNIVWHAWTIMSRAASTMPEDIPSRLLGELSLVDKKPTEQDPSDVDIYYKLQHTGKRNKVALCKFLAQPTPFAVLFKMKRDLDKLEKAVKDDTAAAIEKLPIAPLDVWSGDRKRWVLQWLNSEEML